MSCLPSVTSKRTRKSSPRCTLPALTSPPMRMRVPGARRCSATSVGDWKKTMELLIALNMSPTAAAKTARLQPIKTRRRCFRVITRSTLQPQAFDHVLDAPQLLRIAGERFACIAGRGLRLVPLVENHIGPQQALPAFDVVAVLFETVGKPRHHGVDHGAAVAFAHLRRCGHIGRTGPRRVGRRRSARLRANLRKR